MDTWKKRASFIAFVVLFLLTSVLVTLIPAPTSEDKIEVRLDDDRRLRVEAVTFGKSHVYRTGPEWLEKLQKTAPRWMRKHLGSEVRTIRHTTSSDRVLPWFSIEINPGKSPDWGDLRVVADSGETFEINSRSFPASLPDRRFMLPDMRVIPRRDPSFSITGLVDRLPFSVRIPNPDQRRSIPIWKTAPVPATNRVNGFDIVLAGAELYRGRRREHFSMRFKAYENGRFLKDWFNYSWQLIDATGNEGYLLPTNEPAWRVSLSLRRQLAARWATNEYRDFTITNVPAGIERHAFKINAELGGVKLQRGWIAGPGDYVIEDGHFIEANPLPPGGGNSWSSSSDGSGGWTLKLKRTRPWIMIKHSGQLRDQVVTAFLIDVNGDQVSVGHRGGAGMGTFQTQIFEITPGKKKPTPPFTLRIAGEKYLRTEFTFDPAQIPRVDRRPRKRE